MNQFLIKTTTIIILLLINNALFSQVEGKKVLKIGIIKYKSEKDFINTYKPFCKYIAESCGMRDSLIIFRNNNLGYAVSENKVDIGIFTPFPYINAKQDFPELEVFASHIVNDNAVYKGVILTRTDSQIKSFNEIINKKVLFVKPTSTSGYKYPIGIFREHNIDTNLFSYSFSGSHINSVNALLNNEADVIAVDKAVLNEIDIENTKDYFTILYEYKMPLTAYVFSPELSEKIKKCITKNMFKAHLNPHLNSMFKNPLGIQKWVETNDENYNLIRKFLSLRRVKPNIKYELKIAPKANHLLNKKGDIQKILADNIKYELENSNRFNIVFILNNSTNSLNNKTNINYYVCLDISLVDSSKDLYHCKIFNNNEISRFDIKGDLIRADIPKLFTCNILNSIVDSTELLYNGFDWFITYGTNDGITKNEYQFEIINGNKRKFIIDSSDIEKITPINIFFKKNEFNKNNNYKVFIKYICKIIPKNIENGDNNNSGGSFWDSNFWDKIGIIIGVLLALLTVLIGSYFGFIKKKRFKEMLYQTNDILKEYIEGKYKVENKLIEQRELMNRKLESGNITESQFLILNNRLNDIQKIIEQKSLNIKDISTEFVTEIDDILKDGKITEKEYSRLIVILKKIKNKCNV